MDSKKVGLDIQINLFKFFFDSEYMHYGYWKPGLEVKAPNFKQAQEDYTEYIIQHIPKDVKTILDIGCGSGKVAEELIKRGYQVTCVSPPSNLTDKAAARLVGKAKVHPMLFEDFETNEKFDLALFSESYQYVNLEKGFALCAQLLNPSGHILLIDFFHVGVPGEKSPLGGGHKIQVFYETLKQHPFDMVEDNDITDQIAPTMTLINNLSMDVIYPSVCMVGDLIKSRYPLVYKFLMWKFKKKIEKNRVKHFTGQRSPENFKRFKTYRQMLLKRQA
jgi:SAM-dependent methyltransferase